MQFGIFTVGDVTVDPTTGRAPTEHERIRAMVTLAEHAEAVGLDAFATGVLGVATSLLGSADVQSLADLGNSWKRGNSHRARAATALAAELPGAHSETVPGTVS